MLRDKPEPEYLTRSDVARILKISPKQAGRLMEEMPSVLIGTTHRRVSRSDFDEWIERRKLDEACAARQSERDRSSLTKGAPLRLPASPYRGRVVRKPRPLPRA